MEAYMHVMQPCTFGPEDGRHTARGRADDDVPQAAQVSVHERVDFSRPPSQRPQRERRLMESATASAATAEEERVATTVATDAHDDKRAQYLSEKMAARAASLESRRAESE